MFGGRELAGQAEFGDVARALADYLETRGVLDVVPSDIVTGLVVLQQLQQQRVQAARLAVLEQDSIQVHAIEEGDVDGKASAGLDDDAARGLESVQAPGTVDDDHSGLLGGGARAAAYSTPFRRRRQQQAIPTPPSSRQSIFRFEADGTYQRQRRLLLDRRSFADMYALEEGARYAKYALSIYTAVLYLYVHPISGPARLLAKKGGACCCTKQRASSTTPPLDRIYPRLNAELVGDNHGRIEGDNLCQSHKAAILLTAGLDEADLVYAQLRSGFTETPYCILLDHQWQSVVVAIRGTFSLEDCVTDVLIEPEPLQQLGQEFGFDASGQYCHGGVLACVRNVYSDLLRHGWLDQLLSNSDASYPDYTLRLVGHSLGAAACTLLSYMLRPMFPTLRCVNYSPPGCTLTWEMATGCKEWCNSFVLDTDLVPRLSLDSMDRLRDEILELLGRIKVPKIEVARRAVGRAGLLGCGICWESLPSDVNRLYDMTEILHSPGAVPDSEYQRQLERFREIQRERRATRGVARSTKLFPPGKMIHLAKIGEKRTCVHGIAKCVTCCMTSFGSEYLPVWVNNDDFNEIVVTTTMGTDHFPNRITAVLGEVAKSFGLDSL